MSDQTPEVPTPAETVATPPPPTEAPSEPSAPVAAAQTAGEPADVAQEESFREAVETVKLSYPTVRELLEVGAHFGHQTRRWDPRMKPYLFGERNKVHIIDLDQSKVLFEEALDFVKDVTAHGSKVLFVGTKRQAQPPVRTEAVRAKQYYVNQRWLGGMLTNFKTVKNSVDRFKKYLEILGDPEKRGELTKREAARVQREVNKLEKSLGGIKEMTRLPGALFIIGVDTEQIAVQEARRLGIPVIAIADSNCNPDEIDFIVPGNDDATRAIALYCSRVADACLEGDANHQAKLAKEAPAKAQAAGEKAAPSTGRVVVDMKQTPRRGRGPGTAGASAGGERKPRKGKGKVEKVVSEGIPQAPRRKKKVAEKPAAVNEAAEAGAAEGEANEAAAASAPEVTEEATSVVAVEETPSKGGEAPAAPAEEVPSENEASPEDETAAETPGEETPKE